MAIKPTKIETPRDVVATHHKGTASLARDAAAGDGSLHAHYITSAAGCLAGLSPLFTAATPEAVSWIAASFTLHQRRVDAVPQSADREAGFNEVGHDPKTSTVSWRINSTQLAEESASLKILSDGSGIGQVAVSTEAVRAAHYGAKATSGQITIKGDHL